MTVVTDGAQRAVAGVFIGVAILALVLGKLILAAAVLLMALTGVASATPDPAPAEVQDVERPGRITVGLEPIGFPVLLPAVGGAAGYHIKPDMAVEISHVRNGFSLYVVDVYTRLTTLRLKTYWTKSFYTNTGLGIRTVGARFSLDDVAVTELDAESEVTSLVGDLAIGNRWTLGPLALGCDWIGWVPHLRVIKSHDRFPYDKASEAEQDRKHSRFDKIAAHGTPQFLRVYIGTSF